MLRIYVSIDKLNCPSPTSRVRWHQGPPASPCVKFRRFPRSTISDNSAMCLNTQNRCIRREENAVCILGLDCTDWFHGSASTIHDCVFPCFTHFACCTALLCSRKRNVKSAYAFFSIGESEKIVQTARETWKAHSHFLRLESKSADDAWNAHSSDSRSAYKIHGVRLE